MRRYLAIFDLFGSLRPAARRRHGSVHRAWLTLAGIVVAGCLMGHARPAFAQINPDYVANIAIPGQAEFPRGCDLTAAGLGGQPVTAANQSAYIECLVMGPGGTQNDITNNATRLSTAVSPQLVMGLLYNGPAFAATYNTSGLSSADEVTFLYRLLLFQDPPAPVLAQYALDLDVGLPRQYVVDYIMNDPSFAGINAILGASVNAFAPAVVPAQFAPAPPPFALASVAMTSPVKLRAAGKLIVTASFSPTTLTGEATPFLYLTNAAGAVVATYPTPAYFAPGATTRLKWAVPQTVDIGSGTFTVSLALADGGNPSPPVWQLSSGFASFTKGAEFNPSHKYTTLYNQAYGPLTVEQAQIAIPTRKGAHRAMIMLHGGDWTSGDAVVDGPQGAEYAKNNYVVVSANYRLANLPDSSSYWMAQAQDVQLIARWVRANAVAWNVDPNQVCVYGSSAGGHLANWMGTHPTTFAGDRSSLFSNEPSNVQCVVDDSGPVDLTKTPSTSNYPAIMGGAILSTSYLWYYEGSPLFYVTSTTAPTYIFQGQSDKFVPPAGPKKYAAKLTAAGVPNQYVATKCGHAFSGCPKSVVDNYNAGAMRWIDSILPPP